MHRSCSSQLRPQPAPVLTILSTRLSLFHQACRMPAHICRQSTLATRETWPKNMRAIAKQEHTTQWTPRLEPATAFDSSTCLEKRPVERKKADRGHSTNGLPDHIQIAAMCNARWRLCRRSSGEVLTSRGTSMSRHHQSARPGIQHIVYIVHRQTARTRNQSASIQAINGA